jgi:hypothetical protein
MGRAGGKGLKADGGAAVDAVPGEVAVGEVSNESLGLLLGQLIVEFEG